MAIVKQPTLACLIVAVATVFIGSCVPGWSLDPSRKMSQYSSGQWTIADGLPQGTVYCGLQSKDGFLWLGTQEGLARFDGYQFEVFDRSNTKTLRDHSINALCEDDLGRLWIGTDRGLYVRENRQFRTIGESAGYADVLVWALAVDANGKIWVGSDSHGLLVFEDNKLQPAPKDWGMNGKAVFSILGGEEGQLWIGHLEGLTHVKDDQAHKFGEAEGFRFGPIYYLAKGGQDELWMSCDTGLLRWVNGRFKLFTKADGLKSDNIFSIYQDRAGNVWVGTAYGLCRWREDGVEFENPLEQSRFNPVNQIWEDSENNLWFGSSNDGLFCYRDGALATFAVEEGLDHNMVRAIVENQNGEIVIGTDQGLNLFDGQTIRTMTMADRLQGQRVGSLTVGPDGSIWVGGTDGTVTQVRGETLRRFEIGMAGMPDNWVCALAFDSDGRLWIGSEMGLHILDSGRLVRPGGPLATESNMAIHCDSLGRVWVSSSNRAGYYEKGETERFRELSLPQNSEILCFHKDGRGQMWLGTYGAGLWRFDGANVAVINRDHGLFDNTIFSILEENGFLWMSSNRGIFKIPLKDLNDVAGDRSNRVIAENFGIAEGMKSAECNGATWPAAIRTKTGQLWYATTRGAVRADPSELNRQAISPKIQIMAIHFGEKTYRHGDVIEIPAGPNQLAITYTAPVFREPENLSFRYRLKGFDSQWQYAGDQRSAFYNHLPPGQYQFEVAAALGGGVWNETSQSLTLEITQPWWQLPVLKLVLGLAILMGVLGLVWYRLQKMRESTAVLGRLVEETESHVHRLDRAWSHINVEYLAAVAHVGLGEMAMKVLHSVSRELGDIQHQILTIESLARSQDSSHELLEMKTHILSSGTESEKNAPVQPNLLNVESDLTQIADDLESRQTRMLEQVVALRDEIHSIGEMVEVQQNYAILEVKEDYQNLHALVADVLRMHAPYLQKHQLSFRRTWFEFPPIQIHIIKLFLTIAGLIRHIAVTPTDQKTGIREGLIQIKRVGDASVEISIWGPENENLLPLEKTTAKLHFLNELRFSSGDGVGWNIHEDGSREGFRIRIDETKAESKGTLDPIHSNSAAIMVL